MSHVGRLIITRGLPGAGKTHRAKAWVAEDRTKRCRINRDDFRLMLHGVAWSGMWQCEVAISTAQYAAIRALLADGIDVVSDDTWLDDIDVERIQCLANDIGAQIDIWDMRDVPLSVCLERDAIRTAPVGAKVIRDKYAMYIHG